jgi:hypothetical protein
MKLCPVRILAEAMELVEDELEKQVDYELIKAADFLNDAIQHVEADCDCLKGRIEIE